MSKSVRERAMDVAHVAAYGHSGSPEIEGPVVRAVRGLAAAGLLATPALLECGEACVSSWVEGSRYDKAGRALLAEREGKPTPEPTPSTAEVDAKLYEACERYGLYGTRQTADALAACRKAREKKASVQVSRVTYHDGVSLRQYEVNAEQGAEIARILRLEAK